MNTIYLKIRKILALAILFVGTASQTNAQFPETFDGPGLPSGWIIMDNGVGLSSSWELNGSFTYSPDSAMYVEYESIGGSNAEDWLISPAVTIDPMFSTLKFYQAQDYASDYGTEYTVRISTTTQTDTLNYATVDTQSENDFGLSYTAHYVDLSAYAGMSVYIAFVMTNDDGDSWYLDDMSFGYPICDDPTAISFTNITQTSADISWTSNGSGSHWEIAVVPGGATSGTINSVSSTSYNATGLTSASTYDVYIREQCVQSEALMISGMYDGPLPGGVPKGVELYALEDILDLSIYGVGSANNGTGSPGVEFAFPADTVLAGTYIYVASDSTNFHNFFGFAPDYVSGASNINGDDAYELYKDGTVIDVFGDVNLDGTGQSWEYLDGWALRKDNELNNYGVFVDTNWIYSGTNNLEGGTTNATCNSPFPIGTFTSITSKSNWVYATFDTECPPFTGDSLHLATIISTFPFNDTINTASCYTDTYGNLSPDKYYQYICTDSCIETIDISLCGSSFDTYLEILDAQGSYLVDNDDSDTCGAFSVESAYYGYEVTFGDTIYILVEGYDEEEGQVIIEINANYMNITSTQQDIECHGDSTGTATLAGTLPASSYAYQWDAEANNQTTATATNLTSGTYVWSVTNAGGCVINDSVTLVDLYPAIVVNSSYTDITCFGSSDGTATLMSSGGAGTLTESWGALNPAGLPEGTHTYTVTDSLGCTYVDSVTISEPAEMMLSANVTDEMIGNDGAIDLTVTGGVGPYTFAWDHGDLNEDLNNLPGDSTYIVTVTDINGCEDSLHVFVGSQVSISESADGMNVIVQPNPNMGLFNVAIESNNVNNLRLEIYNPTGQLIRSTTVSGNSTTNIDLTDVSNGLYILKLHTGNQIHLTRVSVLK